MNKNKLITIIVPVFKVEKYLDECIKSLVDQTYKHIEIILVDDGSPDTCPQMCDEWAEKDDRIRVVHKDNKGLSSARNIGLDLAKGDYIMFVDSDDLVDTLICEKLIKILTMQNADIACCDWLKLNEKKRFTSKINVYAGSEVFSLLYNKKVPLIMTAWAKLYKKQIFCNVRYPLGRLHEDEVVIPQILTNCSKLVFLDENLYFNRQNEGSITKSFSEKRLDAVWAKEKILSYIEKNNSDYYQHALNSYLRTIAAYYSMGLKGNICVDKLKELLIKYKQHYPSLKKKTMVLRMFRAFPKFFAFCFNLLKR